MAAVDHTTNSKELSPIEAIWHQAEHEIAAGKSPEAVAPLLGLLAPSFKRAVRCRASRGLWTTPVIFALREVNARDDRYKPRTHRTAEIVALFAQALTAPQIAARLNVPVGYVYRIAVLKKHSFLTSRPKLEDRIDWPLLEQRVNSGDTIYRLAQELLISHAGLWQCIRKRAKLGLWTTPLKKEKKAPMSPKTRIKIDLATKPLTWGQIKDHLNTALGHGGKTALAKHLQLTLSGVSRLLKQANDPLPDRVTQCHEFLIKIGAYTA